MFFQDEPLNTENVEDIWNSVEVNAEGYDGVIKNFTNYKEVFDVMLGQTRKYKGDRDYFPMPIKVMPWLLFENVLTKDSNKTHMKRIFSFIDDKTEIFGKNFRNYVPEQLTTIRKNMLRSKTYMDKRCNFTYNTYWHLTSLVLQTVQNWNKGDSVDKFFYDYMLTANPLLQFIAPNASAKGKRVIIYKYPIKRDPRNYYLDAFFVTDSKKLCDFMLNFPLRQWERTDHIHFSTSKGNSVEIPVEIAIRECFGAWRSFSRFKPESVHPYMEDWLEVIT